jgi:hypothetical protein
VKRQVVIGYVQAMIKAASGLDAALAQGRTDEARVRQAEGWAYYRVIEPLIASVNTTTARTVAGVFDLAAKPSAGAAAKLTAALTPAYGVLRITPEDIGGSEVQAPAADAEQGADEGPDAEEGSDEGPDDEGGPD